jgi:hypothetical protein
LIVPPALAKPQTYQISIRISSRLAVLGIMRVGDLSAILRIMGQRVISVEINYVDYAIARTLLNIVDEWVKTIPKGSQNGIIKKFNHIAIGYRD